MKKILGILVSAALIVAAVALTSSCKKDISNAKALVGTTWTATIDGESISLTFPTSTTFEMVISQGSLSAKATGVFVLTGEKPSLSGSAIALTLSDVPVGFDVFDRTVSGTFKTDTELVLKDGEGIELTFKKK